MPTEYGVRDQWTAFEDDEIKTFDTYEDAADFIDTHPMSEEGFANQFQILKRTVSEWERA